MSLDDAFEITGLLAETVVIGLLIYRRVWQKLPVFFVYCVAALITDSVATAMRWFFPGSYGIGFYFVETVVDFILQFCVLVELAWSVLRPLRPNLSRKAIVFIASAMLVAGAAIWPFAGLAGLALPSKIWHLLVQLEQTASILRILFFLVLAGCCQLLSMGWRDRELQVATGFGFYSLVSLAVAVLNTHQTKGMQFHYLSYVVVVSFIFSLFYWIYSFSQKETERHEFTPQMQHALMALASTARITRSAFEDFATAEPQEPDAY